MNMRSVAVTAILFLILASPAMAIVVVNSLDARDILSGAAYANVVGDSVVFVPQRTDLTVFLSKVENGGTVTLLQSSNPVYVNLEDILSTNKVNISKKIALGDAQDSAMLLAAEARPKGYIIVNPEYGYPAIAAMPYAKLKGYYLMLGFKDNAAKIAEAAKGKPVIVFDYVSPDVTNALDSAGVRYETIAKGDKYLNNIEMTRRYVAETGTSTFLLTDGNVIEESLINANMPILFVSTIVPDATLSFVRERAQKGTVIVNLINSEYIQPVYNMKKAIDAEMGKTAVIARLKIGEAVPLASNTPQECDTLSLPGPYASPYIDSVTYNKNSGTLDIIMGNNGNAPAYMSVGVKAFVGNKVIGVFPSIRDFVNPDTKSGHSFNLTIPEGAEGDMVAEMSVLFGVFNTSLDSAFVDTKNISTIIFIDRSSVMVDNAAYNKAKKALSFLLRNNGSVSEFCKVTVSASDSSGQTITYKDDRVHTLDVGEAKPIIYDMLPFGADVSSVSIMTDCGAREGFLAKNSVSAATVEKEESSTTTMLAAAAAAIIVLIILFLALKGRKGAKEEQTAGRKGANADEKQATGKKEGGGKK
jgi:hypothetical protein